MAEEPEGRFSSIHTLLRWLSVEDAVVARVHAVEASTLCGLERLVDFVTAQVCAKMSIIIIIFTCVAACMPLCDLHQLHWPLAAP